jgi:hypothetical protein
MLDFFCWALLLFFERSRGSFARSSMVHCRRTDRNARAHSFETDFVKQVEQKGVCAEREEQLV